MSRHTKGPWRYERIPSTAEFEYEVGMAFRIQSADPDPRRAAVGLLYHKPTLEEAEANARVIAAAPTLLDAAREAAETIAHILHFGTPPSRATLLEDQARLAAAIALAEGRQP